MLNVGQLNEGVVLDHIEAGKSTGPRISQIFFRFIGQIINENLQNTDHREPDLHTEDQPDNDEQCDRDRTLELLRRAEAVGRIEDQVRCTVERQEECTGGDRHLIHLLATKCYFTSDRHSFS